MIIYSNIALVTVKNVPNKLSILDTKLQQQHIDTKYANAVTVCNEIKL